MITLFLIFGGLVGSTAALAVIAWRGAGQLVHPPHSHTGKTPADYGLNAEPIAFKTLDGLTLRGWFIPAANPKGTIVASHGYAGDCSPDLIYAPLFHHAGYNTLFFDYRGHGASDGTYTSLVYLERDDLLAALDFLHARRIERVGLIGFSMGGAISLAAAPRSPMILGVISDCAFSELRHIVERAAAQRGILGSLAPWLGWLVVLFASVRLRANLFSADPIHWVGQIAPRPVLIMHGANDQDVPVIEAHRLYQAAREPKELWIVPNAAHRKIEDVARDEYRQRVIEFFDRVFSNANTRISS